MRKESLAKQPKCVARTALLILIRHDVAFKGGVICGSLAPDEDNKIGAWRNRTDARLRESVRRWLVIICLLYHILRLRKWRFRTQVIGIMSLISRFAS